MTEPDPPLDCDGEVQTLDATGVPAVVANGADFDEQLLQSEVRARIFGRATLVEVGGYVLQHRIGAGGMGVVYAARDPRLERDVALKLVRPGHARGQERMVREARALAKLAHPNVVAIHEVGTHGDRVFVAMELVPGQTLREWLAAPRSLVEIAGVFAQAGEGLVAAHRAQLVHRDFKPENVIIGDDTGGARSYGRVRVVDFGLARAAAATSETSVESLPAVHDAVAITGTGEVGGTPAYMALEQLEGRDVDARADVFAFCTALYEALHGARPYAASSTGELVAALENGPDALPWRRDLPGKMVGLLRKGLASHAADRPASLDPIIAELRAIESPTRRRALVAAGVVSTLGIGAGVLFVALSQPHVADMIEVAPVKTPVSMSAEDHICPASAEPDPRSCAELEEHLVVAGHYDDWEARCAYRRACATPDPVCPEGTTWDGTVGCSLPECVAKSDDDAMKRCEGGDVTCCLRSSYVRYELGADDPAKTEIIADEIARACSTGDAHACAGLATVSHQLQHDEQSAVAALVTACHFGHLQACRRIAILPEEREGLRSECTLHPDETCDLVADDPVQLVHMAACRTVQLVLPPVIVDNARKQSEELERSGTLLAEGEGAAIDRAEQRLAEQLLAEYRAFWHELGGGPEGETLVLRDLALRVQDLAYTRIDFAQENRSRQKFADARAGILPARPAVRESPLERLFALNASVATRLEDEVAVELGRERAAALRRPRWAGSGIFHMQGGCPD